MFFFLCKLVCESALTHMRTSGILPSSDAMELVKKKEGEEEEEEEEIALRLDRSL